MYIYSGIFGNFLRIFPDFSRQKNSLFEYFWYLFAISGTFQACGNFFGIFQDFSGIFLNFLAYNFLFRKFPFLVIFAKSILNCLCKPSKFPFLVIHQIFLKKVFPFQETPFQKHLRHLCKLSKFSFFGMSHDLLTSATLTFFSHMTCLCQPSKFPFGKFYHFMVPI